MENELISINSLESKIYFIRGQLVMLDSDLAELYNVKTFVLNQAVKRNKERFPENFMFQLTDEEWDSLRSQIVISKEGKGGRRYNPYVFTEYGVVMLSSVLNSKKAIAFNIQVVNTFVKLKTMAITNKEIINRLRELEEKYSTHDKELQLVFEALKQLIEAPEESDKQIGFRVE